MDVVTIRIAVIALTLLCASCIGGVVLASSTGHAVPEILGHVASTTAGALVGIIVQPARPTEPPAPSPH